MALILFLNLVFLSFLCFYWYYYLFIVFRLFFYIIYIYFLFPGININMYIHINIYICVINTYICLYRESNHGEKHHLFEKYFRLTSSSIYIYIYINWCTIYIYIYMYTLRLYIFPFNVCILRKYNRKTKHLLSMIGELFSRHSSCAFMLWLCKRTFLNEKTKKKRNTGSYFQKNCQNTFYILI